MKQYKRIRKDTTPIFFTCSTKFGHSLISANQKNLDMDLIWVKSRCVYMLKKCL